jgi:serine/threonine protein kinase/WD40 repeat protein/tetratricopeptide (TPR) repeat protein
MSTDDLDTSSLPDALGPILESFLARLRRGERPSLKEYADRYPEHADQILELFPPLVEIELAGLVGAAPLHSAARAGDFPGGTADSGAASHAANGPGAPVLERLGDYRILREIGGGGMGIVYEAEREALRSRVALKVMHPRLRSRTDYLRWFHREARAAAGLHHTNIVTVFDYGEHDGVCYYAMQYIAGHSLDKVLEDVKRLKQEAARVGESDGRAVLHGTRTAPLEPTARGVSAPDPGLRSVSVGLFRGVFGSESPASTESLVAAMETTQAMPPAGTEVPPVLAALPPIEPEGEAKAPSASSSLGFAPGSSWSGKSSSRYQREIARIGAQVADALDYAHRRKVIHRDIKPHNILLDALGNAWITDFGLAKLKQQEGDGSSSQAFAGTLRFMAPERFRGKSDGRDDIYALGATLYEFLALRPVFDASDPHQLLSKIEHDPPTPLRQIDRRIHPDLAAIIARTLAKDPADRYASAAELRDELRRFIEGRPVKTRPVPSYARFWRWCKRDPWLAAANIAAAVMTTTLAIGSTIAAKVYYDKSEEIAEQAQRLERSDFDTRERLFESLVSQAEARRFSRRMGQRFESLKALRQAADIGRALKLPPRRLEPLRDQAIACMVLPDLEPAGRVITRPQGVGTWAFDSTMSRYALEFRDGTISVRRVADDHEVARFRGPANREEHLFLFSPDGRYLATTDNPGSALTIWDVDRRMAAMHDPGPGKAAFSPDSERMILAHEDGDFRLYNLVTGQLKNRWTGPAGAYSLAFHPHGLLIAVTSPEGNKSTCRILEAESGRLVRLIPLPNLGFVRLAWSPDGATLATPCDDHKIYLWDAATGTRKATLEGHTNYGLTAAFHPAGTLLASNGWEGRLWLWDPVLGRPWFNLTDGAQPEFSQDGRIVVSFEDELTTYLVDPALEYRTFAHASSQRLYYGSPSIRYDGRVMATGISTGVVLWDLTRGVELAHLPIGPTTYLQFEPSGDLLASSFVVGVLRWPIQLHPERGEFRIGPPRRLPLPAGTEQMAADLSGRIVALAGGIRAYVATPERTFPVGPLDDCRSVAVSPDGQWLATGSHGKNGVQVWRVHDATRVAHPVTLGFGNARFSPDGQWLMTSPPCRLWEVGTWREARQKIGGHGHCFSPDGRFVVVQDASKVIRLVETETGRTLARLESLDLCDVRCAAFSPDGSRLVITTNDGPAVHVWDLRAIRRQLAGMGLDWDAPAYSDDDAARPDLPPLPPLKVDYGPLSGHIEHFSERPEALVERYTARINQNPSDTEAYHLRAHALLNLNRRAEAIADLTQAIRLRPDDAHVLHLRARVYARGFNKLESAIADLEAAMALEPSQPEIRPLLSECCNNQAWLLATGRPSQQDLDRALKLSLRAVELAPGQQVSLNTRGVVLYRAGRYAEAVTILDQSLEAGRGQFDAFDLFFLAMAHHHLGHRDQARRSFDRAAAWMSHPGPLDAQQGKELASFRAEAEAVLAPAGPGAELPADVFAPE